MTDWGDGQGTQAHVSDLGGVAVDGEGNIIVSDACFMRKIAAGLAPPVPRWWQVRHPQLPSVFVSQMEALLDDEACSDVTFVVDDACIPAHPRQYPESLIKVLLHFAQVGLQGGGRIRRRRRRARTCRKEGESVVCILQRDSQRDHNP